MNEVRLKIGAFLLLFLLLIPLVSADSFGQNLYNKLGWISSIDLTQIGPGMNESAFWAKIILWISLFAVLYYVGSTRVFRDQPRIAGILAGVIALGIILVPNELIKRIIQTYQIIGIALLVGVPVFGLLIFISYLKKELAAAHCRVYHTAAAVALYLVTVVMNNLGETIQRNYDIFSYTEWFGFAFAVLELWMLWHIFMIFFCEKSTAAPETPAATGPSLMDRIKSWLGGTTPPAPGGPRPPGRVPSATPRKRYSGDPTIPRGGAPPGIDPHVPTPNIPVTPLPKGPRIPDEKEIFVDLSNSFGPIRCQDGLGACTAFAATSMFEYVLRVGHGLNVTLSPLFLWYKTRERTARVYQNTGPPTCLVPMHNLQTDGVCVEGLWQFVDNTTTRWQVRPNELAHRDAAERRIVTFYSVDRRDPDQWVHQLVEGSPLNIGIVVPDDFLKPYTKNFYDNAAPRAGQGRHAMVVVGYHSHYPFDSKGVKAFKLRNSWDVDWGENGYTWVPADALSKLVFEDLLVIKGKDNGKVPKKQHGKITGRVVFDEDGVLDINSTGKELCESSFSQSEHSYRVGVIAQIGGVLTYLQEIDVNDKFGRFVLDFEIPRALEPATLLSSTYSMLKNVDFAHLPAGVVVYKKDTDGTIGYFHVVDFKYSRGGRGGEGITHPDNPCSSIVHQELKWSGRPIVFTDTHREEQNVVIPVFFYPIDEQPEKEKKGPKQKQSDIKKTLKALAKVKKFAMKEARWIAPAYKYLYNMKNILKQGNLNNIESKLDSIQKDVELVGRAEKIIVRLKKGVDKYAKPILKSIPSENHGELKQLLSSLDIDKNQLLIYTSRYEGEIRKQFNALKKVIKDRNIPPAQKTKTVAAIRTKMLAFADDAVRWQSSLVVQLDKLKELCQRIAQSLANK